MAAKLKREAKFLKPYPLTKVPAMDKEFQHCRGQFPKPGKKQFALAASWICFRVNLRAYIGYISVFLYDFMHLGDIDLDLTTANIEILHIERVSKLGIDAVIAKQQTLSSRMRSRN